MNQVFSKGAAAPVAFPVTDLAAVTAPSGLASPRVGDSHGLPSPTMPGDAGFEAELQEVADVRMHVLDNKWPSHFLAKYHPRQDFDPDIVPVPVATAIKDPLASRGFLPYTVSPSEAANVVHMDRPTDLPFLVWDWLRTQDVRLKNPTGHVDFLETVPQPLAAMATAASDGLERAFQAKYFFGRPRPEEVFNRCPDHLGTFTHYEEGCPTHPAYPAGHGAAAASVAVLFDIFDMDDPTRDVIVDSAYHWAMYRTFAGVHYADDNLAGLVVGGLGAFDSAGNWVV